MEKERCGFFSRWIKVFFLSPSGTTLREKEGRKEREREKEREKERKREKEGERWRMRTRKALSEKNTCHLLHPVISCIVLNWHQ